MDIYTQNKQIRPKRLSEQTFQFAYESLHRKYGLDTLKTEAVVLDDIENFDMLPPLKKYDLAITKIVKNAPLRICEGEKISGAATLGLAISHVVPATYNGDAIYSSISHLTIDFESVLRYGVNGIREKVKIAFNKYKGTEKEAFIISLKNCLDAFDIWHSRYLDELKDLPDYKNNYENLKVVPNEPAKNFYQAVQSIWFVFAFVRLCGNWPGIGRIDYLLGDYLKKDLKTGAITIEEAREILAHFFIKGCEWVNGQIIGSGDGQHYQNILLGGIDKNGKEVTNEVTYLVLDILEELGIGDFPTSVRINKKTDEKLLDRVAEVMRFGGGILAVYNEDVVIEALIKDGYELKEARKFANDGCWEVQIPGKTYFTYVPFDALQILQKQTLSSYDGALIFSDFDDLYNKYINDLNEMVEKIYLDKKQLFKKCDVQSQDWAWTMQMPCTVVSLFEQGCIEKGLSYLEGGPVYNVVSPHIGGLADVVNSLYSIKKLVFDEKKVSFSTLMNMLKSNWEQDETLRQYILNHYEYYGNDNDEVDEIAARLLSDYADICTAYNGKCGYRFPAGVSTFGRQLDWSQGRLATAYGRKKGAILAGNCSPTPNTDKEGATAIIRSYCKVDFTKIASGSALDVKLLPSSVDGESGLQALKGLIRGFVNLGGFFMQPDVVDTEILRRAQENPDEYQTLAVRISGWNARFITLDKQWQDMVIEQNEHK